MTAPILTSFRYKLASRWTPGGPSDGWITGSYESRRGRLSRATVRRRLSATWRAIGERVTALEILDPPGPVRCRVCGELGNTVPYSTAGTCHRYGPTTHDFEPSEVPDVR